MFYISTAMYSEAKPIIEHFHLKKQPSPSRFQRFTGPEMALIVGGAGTLAAAVSTAYLLTAHHAGENGVFINIGICGSASRRLIPGQPVLCHKIIHHETKRTYYPDMLIRHEMAEGTLETFSRPVNSDMRQAIEGDIVDMEGAGCYEAASVFLPPHRMHFIKVVSDALDADRLKARDVSHYIGEALHVVENLMENASHLDSANDDNLDETDLRLLEAIQDRLRLSVTMRHQLHQLAIQYKIRTERPLDCLVDFLSADVQTKSEGKMCFEQIKRRLLHS
jgi:hypothetical protein